MKLADEFQNIIIDTIEEDLSTKCLDNPEERAIVASAITKKILLSYPIEDLVNVIEHIVEQLDYDLNASDREVMTAINWKYVRDVQSQL
jgi:hypothetical protein